MKHTDPDILKKQVLKWSEKLGRDKAQRELIVAGLSFSLAYQLCVGTYPSEPKERVIEILKKVLA